MVSVKVKNCAASVRVEQEWHRLILHAKEVVELATKQRVLWPLFVCVGIVIPDKQRGVLALRNRAADVRLLYIERALRKVEARLNAAIEREDAGDATADTRPPHHEVKRLLREVAKLHPKTNAGIFSKARIAFAYFELAYLGRIILHSLAADLQTGCQRERGPNPRV